MLELSNYNRTLVIQDGDFVVKFFNRKLNVIEIFAYNEDNRGCSLQSMKKSDFKKQILDFISDLKNSTFNVTPDQNEAGVNLLQGLSMSANDKEITIVVANYFTVKEELVATANALNEFIQTI